MAKESKELQITSPSFKHREPIPKKFTCDGEDTSPPLHISGTPFDAITYAIIVDDPDAPMGDFVHWVAWNLDPSQGLIEEGAKVPAEGKNDFRVNRYRGPCPPPGKPHRYFFKVFALDTILDLPESTTKNELLKAMQRHIKAKGELIGIYQRG